MSKSRDIADSAATINYIDNVTSDVQSQINTLDTALDNISVTSGTLTKTFAKEESASINLTSSVLAPVVSVTKEVPQTGVTNNSWDVNSTEEDYTRLNSAYNTTLNFANPYNFYKIANTNTLDVATYLSSNVTDFVFKSDGTKLYITDSSPDDVTEFALSTAWDVSTATYVQEFSVSAQDTNPKGIAFNNDGTKMFVTGQTNDNVYEYSLSSAWDISTASFAQSFSIAANSTTPWGLAFNADGTKMFVSNYNTDKIIEYTLSTGFDVSTASYSQELLLAANLFNAPMGINFSPDGTIMLVVDYYSQLVVFTLSTGFDISTATYSTSIGVEDGIGAVGGVAFGDSGNKFYFSSREVIYENDLIGLSLGSGAFAASDVGKTIKVNSGSLILLGTDNSFYIETAPTSYSQAASGDWQMYSVVYNTTDDDLELSGIAKSYDLVNAQYSNNFVRIADQEALPQGIKFNNDGTKMFTIGTQGDSIYEYTLSTAWDLNSASYVDSFSVAAQETLPSDLHFSTDGTKVFVVGYAGQDVIEYSLSTAFDISTASYVRAYSVATRETQPKAIAFNSDGTDMFIIGYQNKTVYTYRLNTAWSLISVTALSYSYDVGTNEGESPKALAFNSDGTEMFVIGATLDYFLTYTLSTAWNVSTATYAGAGRGNLMGNKNCEGICFSPDGNYLFYVDSTSDSAYRYQTGWSALTTGHQAAHTTTSIDSTYWTDINSMTADQNAGDGNVYYAISTDDRTTWTVIDNTDGERDIVRNNAGTWQYNSNGTYASETWVNGTTNTELATLAEAMEGATDSGPAYDIAQAAYDSKSFAVTSQETLPRGIAFNADGTKVYIVGLTNDTVFQYSLSTAYDISTAAYDTISFSVASQELNPSAITFNADGTKMYIAGGSNDTVYQYTLSTAFNVGTASYDSVSLLVSGQITSPNGLFFKPDGTELYVSDGNSPNGFQYTLTTAFDLSTASYSSKTFSWSSQSAVANSLQLNGDGTKAYILDIVNEKVLQYSLSTAYDLSTATYSSVEFSVVSEITAAETMVFAPNGSKLYVVGTTSTIYQYSTQAISYTNQMDKTQLDAVTDPNHIALGNDLDLAIVFNMTSGSTVPSSDGVAINYDANVLNKGAVLGTDYDFDAPTQNSVRITALAANNLKVRVV